MSELLYLFIYFFFFKQKTAYEMRISVWSSDVCSSDLASLERTMAILARQIEDNRERLAEQIDTLMAMGDGVASRLGTLRDDVEQEIASVSLHSRQLETSTGDRKTVGEGKSVAGRVELGGGRAIKKKKQKQKNTQT